jgi:hypothetical protein
MRGERNLLLAACGIAFLWTVTGADFQHPFPPSVLIGIVTAVIAALIVAGRTVSAWLVLAFFAGASVWLRLITPQWMPTTDPITATEEALNTLLRLQNPYTHHFLHTQPPGMPFPYLPGEMLFYAIQRDFIGLGVHDRFWGIAAVLLLASLAGIYGPTRAAFTVALYGLGAPMIGISLEGGNDTALGFLVITAVVILAFAKRENSQILLVISGAVFGWALAFKLFAWVTFPFVARAIDRHRRLYLGVTLGILALFCAPFLVWDPVAFVSQVFAAFTVHTGTYGLDLWVIFPRTPRVVESVIFVVGTLGFGALMWLRKPQSVGDALLQSAFPLVAALLLAHWDSFAYFAYVVAVLSAAIASYASVTERHQVPDAAVLPTSTSSRLGTGKETQSHT